MADSLELEIVTPDKRLVKESADEVQIPGKAGDIGILPGHDVPRAQAAKTRAEEAQKNPGPDFDYEANLNAIKRADVRIKVALYANEGTIQHT